MADEPLAKLGGSMAFARDTHGGVDVVVSFGITEDVEDGQIGHRTVKSAIR